MPKDIDSWMLPVDIACLAVVSLWWLRRACHQSPSDHQREIGLGLAVCIVLTALSQVASISLNWRYMLALVPMLWPPCRFIVYGLGQFLNGDHVSQLLDGGQGFSWDRNPWSLSDVSRRSDVTIDWGALEEGAEAEQVPANGVGDAGRASDAASDTSLVSTLPDSFTCDSSSFDGTQNSCCCPSYCL